MKANDRDLAREGWLRDWCTIPTNARLRADDAARRGFDAGADWQRWQPCPRAEALAECQTERDSLAAQVAMLREHLRSWAVALDEIHTKVFIASEGPHPELEAFQAQERALHDLALAATVTRRRDLAGGPRPRAAASGG